MEINSFDIKEVLSEREARNLKNNLNAHCLFYNKQITTTYKHPKRQDIPCIRVIAHFESQDVINYFKRLIKEKKDAGKNDSHMKKWKENIKVIQRLVKYKKDNFHDI